MHILEVTANSVEKLLLIRCAVADSIYL